MKTIKLIAILFMVLLISSSFLILDQAFAQRSSNHENNFYNFSGLELFTASHRLGRGRLRPNNVNLIDDKLVLSSPANSYHGAEVRTKERYGYGVYSATIKSDYAPGSFTAFFLYQDVKSENDEIDIEIHNDGSRQIDFVTFKDGVKTNKVSQTLDFDPVEDYYRYTIDYQPGLINFYVEDELLASFEDDLPDAEMKLMVNHWWPVWLESERNQPESKIYIKSIDLE